MNKIIKVFLDWSGTLSDDFQQVLNSVNGVLGEYGVDPVSAKYLRCNYKKDPFDFYIEFGIKDTRENIKAKYKKHFAKQDRPYPMEGAKLVLEELVKLNTSLSILSTHPSYFLEQEVEEYGFDRFFPPSDVQGGVLIKSDVLKKARNNHERIYMIGDTWVDMEEGKKAGVTTIGVLGGYNDRSLLEPHADHIVERLPGIVSIIRTIPKPL